MTVSSAFCHHELLSNNLCVEQTDPIYLARQSSIASHTTSIGFNRFVPQLEPVLAILRRLPSTPPPMAVEVVEEVRCEYVFSSFTLSLFLTMFTILNFDTNYVNLTQQVHHQIQTHRAVPVAHPFLIQPTFV